MKTTENFLSIFALGGINEIGKNMYVIQYGNDILVVDCGGKFPDESLLWIDLIIPDMTYLEENKENIKALIVTHLNLIDRNHYLVLCSCFIIPVSLYFMMWLSVLTPTKVCNSWPHFLKWVSHYKEGAFLCQNQYQRPFSYKKAPRSDQLFAPKVIGW